MLKIGIITYHNGSNYGAVLQSFALQYVLSTLSYKTYIINYQNTFITKGLNKIRNGMSLLGLYYLWYDIVNYRQNQRKIARFRHFFKDYYNLTPLNSANELKNSPMFFDLGICGSDQIWNPLLNHGFDDIYFLRFGSFKSKMSYGSSLGAYKFDNDVYNNQLKVFLSDFSRISVRENPDKLKKLLNKEVKHVCDPTLLINADTWAKSLRISHKNEKYLLVYALADFESIVDIARSIAIRRGMKTICIGKQMRNHRDVEYVLDAGPIEFVDLFYNASYVVTNSFHGTAFSVNFKKQFISITHSKSPERAYTLLKLLGLWKQQVKIEDATADVPDISDADYAIATEKLEKFREESLMFLTDDVINE